MINLTRENVFKSMFVWLTDWLTDWIASEFAMLSPAASTFIGAKIFIEPFLYLFCFRISLHYHTSPPVIKIRIRSTTSVHLLSSLCLWWCLIKSEKKICPIVVGLIPTKVAMLSIGSISLKGSHTTWDEGLYH